MSREPRNQPDEPAQEADDPERTPEPEAGESQTGVQPLTEDEIPEAGR